MKKKMLTGIAGFALLFVFVLVGCEETPTEFTNINHEALNTLPGPGNLRAEAYPGLIIVSWDMVANAASYGVYRYDTETGETRHLGDIAQGNTTFVYQDIVGWNNQLVDDREYRYTVISMPAPGWGVNRTATGAPILSGESSVWVRADVPARNAFTPDLPTALTTERLQHDNLLLVTFEGQPYLQYEVFYTWGSSDQYFLTLLSTATASDRTFGENNFANTRAVRFPLIGGSNTVTVRASFIGGQEYYTASADATAQTGELAYENLTMVSNFSAIREGVDFNEVRFNWQLHDGVGITYEIYKIQTSTTPWLTGTGTGTTTVGNWVRVSLQDEETAFGWRTALERNVPAAQSLRYIIIARGPNNSSSRPTTPYIVNSIIIDP